MPSNYSNDKLAFGKNFSKNSKLSKWSDADQKVHRPRGRRDVNELFFQRNSTFGHQRDPINETQSNHNSLEDLNRYGNFDPVNRNFFPPLAHKSQSKESYMGVYPPRISNAEFANFLNKKRYMKIQEKAYAFNPLNDIQPQLGQVESEQSNVSGSFGPNKPSYGMSQKQYFGYTPPLSENKGNLKSGVSSNKA